MPSDPASHPAFDPWTAPLDELAAMAREIETFADGKYRDLSTSQARQHFAAHILDVLQARATIDAAKRQADTASKLVLATWALVAATIVLALVAILGG